MSFLNTLKISIFIATIFYQNRKLLINIVVIGYRWQLISANLAFVSALLFFPLSITVFIMAGMRISQVDKRWTKIMNNELQKLRYISCILQELSSMAHGPSSEQPHLSIKILAQHMQLFIRARPGTMGTLVRPMLSSTSHEYTILFFFSME